MVAPDLYQGFPTWARTVLGSGVVAGTLTAVLLHALFRVVGKGEQPGRSPGQEDRPAG